MNYSAQAIVIDRNRNVYLEDNEVISALSFIGGSLKGGEGYLEAVRREVQEELGLIIPEERFIEGELQEVSKFWNARVGKELEWLSMYYILIFENQQEEETKSAIKLIKTTVEKLSLMDQIVFPSREKNKFLSQVQRALHCL